jgi:crotonobetainyl-CoA:carnitine CoA-transferase CaiB-like acyl-CoA transferase
MTNALDGLRVEDRSESIAGQYCGRLLADYGADVLLVEPAGGSVTRRMGPMRADGSSYMFFHLNFGKRGCASEPGADILLLPAGFDRASLPEDPRRITCTISGFGEDGPRANWKGGELIYQALSGVMYRNGDPKGMPLYGCGHRASYVAGTAAYISVLAALHARRQTGRGQHCSVDIAECAASMTYALATQFLYNGVPEYRSEPQNLPSGVLQCTDGWVSIFIYAYRWRGACEALGLAEMADHPRYATAEARMENWPEVIAAFQSVSRDMTCQDFIARLQAHDQVAGKAVYPSELISHPHLLARDYWQTVDTPSGPRTMLGPLFRMEKTPRHLKTPRTLKSGALA